jgi:hypothetical protein
MLRQMRHSPKLESKYVRGEAPDLSMLDLRSLSLVSTIELFGIQSAILSHPGSV